MLVRPAIKTDRHVRRGGGTCMGEPGTTTPFICLCSGSGFKIFASRGDFHVAVTSSTLRGAFWQVHYLHLGFNHRKMHMDTFQDVPQFWLVHMYGNFGLSICTAIRSSCWRFLSATVISLLPLHPRLCTAFMQT